MSEKPHSANAPDAPPDASGPAPLTLSQIHETLKLRGVVIGYTSLSELISAGNIGQQLGVSGGRNRRAFPPLAADILAAFIPLYREKDGRLSQAPGMLEAALRHRNGEPPAPSDIIETAKPETKALLPGKVSDPILAARVQGLAGQDRVFTAREAATFLHISPALLRRTVKPYRRFGLSAAGDRWRLSDLLLSEDERAVSDISDGGVK